MNAMISNKKSSDMHTAIVYYNLNISVENKHIVTSVVRVIYFVSKQLKVYVCDVVSLLHRGWNRTRDFGMLY
jgi:hypothetical protein